MGDKFKKLKLAAVQAAPIFLDRESTVEKTCQLIRQAGDEGADVIGFPEGFIAGHPGWVNYIAVQQDRSLHLCKRMFQNSVEIPSAATTKLQLACREANITAVVGLNEKAPETTGTIWNSQLFIDRNGDIIGKRRKLVPTLGERVMHAPGDSGSARAYRAHFGGISGLICGENSNPLAAFAISVGYPVVHVASWPAHFNRSQSMQESILVATRGLAYQLKTFIINSCAVISDDMIDAYGETEEDRAHMRQIQALGGSSIIAPTGQVIAEMGPGEGILYADVDLDDVIIPKFVHDFAGHYNRPDIFSVRISDRGSSIFEDQSLEAQYLALPPKKENRMALSNDLLQVSFENSE